MKKITINHNVFFSLFACAVMLCGAQQLRGQGGKERVPFSIEVAGSDGAGIAYATVYSSKNRVGYITDPNGRVELEIQTTDILRIEAPGYRTKLVSVTDLADEGGRAVLEADDIYDSEADVIYTVTGDKISARRTVGAYSKVDGEDLVSNPTMSILDALGGRLNGLFYSGVTDAPGYQSWSGFVRAPQGSLTVMIDGVERDFGYIEPEMIESVQLLKDASLKSLYGGIQSNGIIMIKTKRGKAYENYTRINVLSGVQTPTRLPEYLNAYDYTTLYNQALQRSGMQPMYDPENYRNGDPVLYPDVDYYKQFLHKFQNVTRVNGQFTGGSENTQYFVHFGYQKNGGLEKYTSDPQSVDNLNLRGNVDYRILDFIDFKAGFNGSLENRKWYNVSSDTFFNVLSSTRPNEFPIFIPGDRIGQPDTEFVLGSTVDNRDNPYGLLTGRGTAEGEYIYMQSDFTFDIDLGRWVEGLHVRPGVSFDVYNYFQRNKAATFVAYELGGDGSSYSTWGQDTRSTSFSRNGQSTNRNWVLTGTATYDRTFGRHSVSALATYFQQEKIYSGLIQRLKRMNLGGLVNYMYDNRFIAEVSVNRVGVGSFAPSKRFGTFPTVGAGWIMSEESFMKGAQWLDYFKVRASYGILGSTTYTSDDQFASILFRDERIFSETYGHSNYNTIVELQRTGNPNLGFQKSHEFNVGADLMVLDRSLTVSAGYFRNKLKGGISNLSNLIPGVIGNDGALMSVNYRRFMSEGFEAEAMYGRRFGDWKFSLGANFTHGTSKYDRNDEITYPQGYEGLNSGVRFGDVMGYRVVGTYADAADIASSPRQSFGKVFAGDLKYEDRNRDGIIDERDMVKIANTTPSWQYGITLSVEWKGFNLDVLGYGLAGFDRVLDNKYYKVYGNGKYSKVVVDGLPNGNPYPILRAEPSENNYVDSDYWVTNGSWFKIRNVELGYTFNPKLTDRAGIHNIKIFFRGHNLLTVSKIKDLDPESLTAGVTNFPLFTTLTGGISFSF